MRPDLFAVGGTFASIYCQTLQKEDERISRFLDAIEAKTQRKLTHYIRPPGGVEKIRGSRLEFISEWLPRPVGGAHSRSLSPAELDESAFFVSFTNVSGKFNLRKDGEYCGHIEISAVSTRYDHLFADALASLVEAAEGFHGVVENDRYAKQRLNTKQTIQMRIARKQAARNVVEASRRAEIKRLEAELEACEQSLDQGAIECVAPNGKKFQSMLDWVNFWNGETMKHFGLPDLEFQKRFAGLARSVTGGWIVRLGQDPPDIANAEDKARIEWLYRRVSQRV